MAPHFICFALHSLLYPSHGAGLICKRARARRIGALSLSTGRTKEAPREGCPRSLRAREGGTRAEWREDGGRPGLRTVAAPASMSRAFLVVEALARPARALARGARCPARERPAHNLQVFASLPLPSSFHPPPRPLKVRRDLLHACALGRLPARWIGHLSSWAAGERREEIEGGGRRGDDDEHAEASLGSLRGPRPCGRCLCGQALWLSGPAARAASVDQEEQQGGCNEGRPNDEQPAGGTARARATARQQRVGSIHIQTADADPPSYFSSPPIFSCASLFACHLPVRLRHRLPFVLACPSSPSHTSTSDLCPSRRVRRFALSLFTQPPPLHRLQMKVEICSFSGYKIYPSRGKLYVRGDSKVRRCPRQRTVVRLALTNLKNALAFPSSLQVFRFLNQKSESLFLQRKNPRKIAWTQVRRRPLHLNSCLAQAGGEQLARARVCMRTCRRPTADACALVPIPLCRIRDCLLASFAQFYETNSTFIIVRVLLHRVLGSPFLLSLPSPSSPFRPSLRFPPPPGLPPHAQEGCY